MLGERDGKLVVLDDDVVCRPMFIGKWPTTLVFFAFGAHSF